MLSVLLIILKIIGIVLLSIIGILLCLLLLVLFVPVRYRIKGYYKDEFVCHGKVSWLLRLISFSFDVEKGTKTSLRILGIPATVFKRKVKKKTEETINHSVDKIESTVNSKAEETAADFLNESSQENVFDVPVSETVDENIDEISENIEEKKSFFDRIKSFLYGLYQKINNIIIKIKEIWNKIREIPQKIRIFFIAIEDKKTLIERYLSILKCNTTKQAFLLCKKRLICMFKHILPKKIKIIADYGFADPSTTGYILALYGVLPPSIGKKIILHPDFERDFFECDFELKGSIRMWTLLYQVIRILLDSNCREFYHMVKKEIKNERK